jgi:hypothetical protein
VGIAYWREMYAYREGAVKPWSIADLRLANQEAKQDYPASKGQRAVNQRLRDGGSRGSVHGCLSSPFVKRNNHDPGAGGVYKCRPDDTPVSLDGDQQRCGNQADLVHCKAA